MSVLDDDLELLEAHLDGELPPTEEESLGERLNAEPGLAAALKGLRLDRELRHRAWQSMEPKRSAVEAFSRAASRQIQAAAGEQFWQRTSGRLRGIAAAAACLLIGFSLGRIVNSGVLNPQSSPGPTVAGSGSNPIAATGGRQSDRPDDGDAFEVLVTDDRGLQIGVHRFPTRQSATEFVNHVNQYQRRNQRVHDAQVIPVADEF